jgi:uncharacterized protein with GYD domain
MAVYMTQFNYTSEAWSALAKNPTNRREIIDKVFQAVGGRLIELYYCLGEYDGVLLVEAPDDSAIVSALVAVAGAGHARSIKTTKLLSADEMVESLRKAGSITFSGPS